MKALLLASILAVTSCKTAPELVAPAQVVAAPTWSSATGVTEFLPIITVEGRPYLLAAHALHSFEWGDEEHLRGLRFPVCFDDNAADCPKVQPATDDMVTQVGSAPEAASVHLITPTGLCAPAIGKLAVVNTTGCDPSLALAFALTGCSGAFAPVAIQGPSAGSDVRWVPATRGALKRYVAGRTLADAGHSARVASWFTATVPAEPGTPLDARTMLQTAAGEREVVKARRAAAHLHRPQCEDMTFELDEVGIEVGPDWRPVSDAHDLAGAVFADGYAVAILSDDGTHFGVYVRGPGDGFSQVASLSYYRDNEECYDTGPVGYEQDCAP